MTDARNPESICADCNAPNPKWASINRGVVVCDECCSVHRSLGRHISYIRSLHSTNWPPAVREMLSTLVRKGSNSIWEHALRDSGSKVRIKKPSPRDKLHPTKHDFIVSKYKHLALLPRATLKESPNMTQDLSKQLHASVRTSNLETCLRLLSLGADPNYRHPDRGNTPLHVAAHAGQAMQVELLVVHGANPTVLDLLGHTPEECARIAGHHQLADRLIETQYELTDKLSFFLCGRKPVHSIGEHYLIPLGSEVQNRQTDAQSKLQQLSNDSFEELAADIYDEVDRRETDAIWLTNQQLQNSIAFLPVNPTISPMRNQGRQKLATLDAKEFSLLVIDLLLDTKRRQNISLETGQRSGNIVPTSSGFVPEHDYDDVPEESVEGDGSGEGVPLRHRSKLTPPIESTYSVVGEDSPTPNPIIEDHYSHLRDQPEIKMGEGDGEGIVEKESYSFISTPDPIKEVTTVTESEYSVVSDNKISKYRKNPPPALPARPKTTYARYNSGKDGRDRVNIPSPGPMLSEVEETVSKIKFNLIMEQLRKVQKDKEELTVENELLNQKVNDLQKQLNKIITENSDLRKSSATPESTTSKSPTSPTFPPVPVPQQDNLPSPSTQTISEIQSMYAYSEVNKKFKPPPPAKPKTSLQKTWSTPPFMRNTSPLPHTPSLSPQSRTTTPSMSSSPQPLPPTNPSKSTQPSISSIESVESSVTGKETPLEDSAFDEETQVSRDNGQSPPLLPPPPPHRTRVISQPSKQLENSPVYSKDPPAPAPLKLPSVDTVHAQIKNVTFFIQELLKAAQTQRQDEFARCSLSITAAVNKVIQMFPSKLESPELIGSIRELESATSHLQKECQNPSHQDLAYHTRLVITSAYDVVKAARFLVTCMENLK